MMIKFPYPYPYPLNCLPAKPVILINIASLAHGYFQELGTVSLILGFWEMDK